METEEGTEGAEDEVKRVTKRRKGTETGQGQTREGGRKEGGMRLKERVIREKEEEEGPLRGGGVRTAAAMASAARPWRRFLLARGADRGGRRLRWRCRSNASCGEPSVWRRFQLRMLLSRRATAGTDRCRSSSR